MMIFKHYENEARELGLGQFKKIGTSFVTHFHIERNFGGILRKVVVTCDGNAYLFTKKNGEFGRTNLEDVIENQTCRVVNEYGHSKFIRVPPKTVEWAIACYFFLTERLEDYLADK